MAVEQRPSPIQIHLLKFWTYIFYRKTQSASWHSPDTYLREKQTRRTSEAWRMAVGSTGTGYDGEAMCGRAKKDSKIPTLTIITQYSGSSG